MTGQTWSIAEVERETGLGKDTLRVWERRYGFPVPMRDKLGERVYPDEQVQRLRLLKRLLDAGHRPGKVVPLPAERLQALLQDERRWQPYLLSVVASIGGWVALLPWCLGWTWPGPALLVLGLAVLLSPLADRRLAASVPVPAGWLQLRAMMATGLGSLTVILGLLA